MEKQLHLLNRIRILSAVLQLGLVLLFLLLLNLLPACILCMMMLSESANLLQQEECSML